MSKSVLAKLFTAIIILFIVCIPEFFKTQEDNYLILSCVDACSDSDSLLSLLSNISIMCMLQEDQSDKNNNLENLISQNHTISGIILSNCPNSSHVHAKLSICKMGIQGNNEYLSLEIRGEYQVYSYEDLYFVLVNSEDNPLSEPFIFGIYIKNVTEEGELSNTDISLFQAIDMTTQFDIINVSLQFNSYVPYYKSNLGMIWLVLVLLIFVITSFAFVCQVVNERKEKPAIKVYRIDVTTTVNTKLEKKKVSTNLQNLQHALPYVGKNIQMSYSLPPIPEHGDSSEWEMD